MGIRDAKRTTLLFYLIILVAMAITFGLTKLQNNDVWWHFAAGDYILQKGEIPKTDIFSYTAFGKPWVNHEWLFQVFTVEYFKLFGPEGIIIFKALATLGIAALVFFTFTTLIGSRNAAIWGTLIVVASMADRLMYRPFIISVLMTALFCFLLHRYRLGRVGNLWILPILTPIWFNLHGGGLMAPQLVGAVALGDTIQYLLAKKGFDGTPPAIEKKRIFHLWIISILCGIACIINPYGIHAFLFAVEHLNMNAIVTFTYEWMPILATDFDYTTTLWIAKLVIAITLISYILGRKKVQLAHLFLTILTALLLTKGRRFSAEFVMINLPIAMYNFSTITKRAFKEDRRSIMHLSSIAILLCIIFAYGMPTYLKHSKYIPRISIPGFGARERFSIRNLTKFLDNNNIDGRVFNSMELGGNLISTRWPKNRVFIDGRTPVFGDDFFMRYVMSLSDPQYFEIFDKQYRFDYIILSPSKFHSDIKLHLHLAKSPEWKLIYNNNDGIVFVRNIPRFEDIIEKHSLDDEIVIKQIIQSMKKLRKK